jgi:glycine cleavage system aminomethyltransferase T
MHDFFSGLAPGTELAIEWTVEHRRKTVPARVVERPFFDPERKRT